jgi:flagellar protein FlaJ
MEAEFPALLRDLALSRKSGMTLSVAVSIAAKGEYGALTEAIKWVDNMMSWGVSFEEAMMQFAEKYSTPLIKRSISIIIEGSKMGGEIGEILETVAVDAEEIKALAGKRRSETLPYIAIGYLSYFVFVAVIIVLCTQFLPMMEETARQAQAAGTQMPGFGLAVSERDIELYKMLFFHALLIQGLFCGLVTSKIGEGTMFAGLKHSAIFVIVGFITYSVLT